MFPAFSVRLTEQTLFHVTSLCLVWLCDE